MVFARLHGVGSLWLLSASADGRKFASKSEWSSIWSDQSLRNSFSSVSAADVDKFHLFLCFLIVQLNNRVEVDRIRKFYNKFSINASIEFVHSFKIEQEYGIKPNYFKYFKRKISTKFKTVKKIFFSVNFTILHTGYGVPHLCGEAYCKLKLHFADLWDSNFARFMTAATFEKRQHLL